MINLSVLLFGTPTRARPALIRVASACRVQRSPSFGRGTGRGKPLPVCCRDFYAQRRQHGDKSSSDALHCRTDSASGGAVGSLQPPVDVYCKHRAELVAPPPL